jgi:hypothetical protein
VQAGELLERAMRMESSHMVREMLEEVLAAAGITRLLRPATPTYQIAG